VFNMMSKVNTGLISKTYSGDTISSQIEIINDECTGCDITKISTLAQNEESKIHLKEENKQTEKMNRSKSFVGHFITKGNGRYFYVHNFDLDGCLNANIYPTRVRTDENYVHFSDKCNHEKYHISENVAVCPNCDGWGLVGAEIVYQTEHKTVDNQGKEVGGTYTTTTHTGKEENITCSVCKGGGLISIKN